MDQPKRRLSAVWFADIVGYTTVSSQDEPAALQLVEILQRHAREAIAANEGRIVKYIGDAVLAEFGSTESAVRAAVALQESYEKSAQELGRESKLRVGVHLGEVNATPDGDLYGDGINTAARLQGEAQPGQVLASEDVWRQLRQRPEFRFAPLGAVELKGITTKVEVYDVLFGGRAALGRAGDAETRPSRRTRTGMHPALLAALIVVPLVVGGSLMAKRFMAAKGTEGDAVTAPAPAAVAPAPLAAAPAPETVVVVQSAPPAAAATVPTTVPTSEPAASDAPAGPRADLERPPLRPRGQRGEAAIPLGPIREFLEGFVASIVTQPPRVALERVFPNATPVQLRGIQQLRQNMAENSTLRLGPVLPRGMRGDTADVRFVILGTGRGGREMQIPFEALIVRDPAGFRFTEMRGIRPN